MRVSGLFAAPDSVEVIPGMHMGAAPSRRAARALTASGVTFAVDLRAASVRSSPWPEAVQVFSCPLVEYEAPDLPTLFGITKQMAALIESGEIIYVHCRAGVQRAPMVACAVLVQMGWDLADAFRLISSRRGVTAMNETQLAVLSELSDAVADSRVARATRGGVEQAGPSAQSLCIPGRDEDMSPT